MVFRVVGKKAEGQRLEGVFYSCQFKPLCHLNTQLVMDKGTKWLPLAKKLIDEWRAASHHFLHFPTGTIGGQGFFVPPPVGADSEVVIFKGQ